MGSLSSAQFSGFGEEQPVRDNGPDLPLPAAAQTYSSADRAAIWRQPRGMSLQRASMGSFFNPFADQQQDTPQRPRD